MHKAPEGSGWTCSTDTGGTCSYLGCKSWHGKTQCVEGRCVCASGYCQENGVCARNIPNCQRSTGGTCGMLGCASSRRAICQNSMCMCREGECATEGRCS